MDKLFEVLMSGGSPEEQEEKLMSLLGELVQTLPPEDCQHVGANIAFNRLQGLMDILTACDNDVAFHAGLKTTVAYVMAGLTRISGIDGDLLTAGHGEKLADECYAYIREKVEAHLKAIQDEHDRLELN